MVMKYFYFLLSNMKKSYVAKKNPILRFQSTKMRNEWSVFKRCMMKMKKER